MAIETDYKSKFLALYAIIDSMHHNLDYTGTVSNKKFLQLYNEAVALKNKKEYTGGNVKEDYLDYTVGP